MKKKILIDLPDNLIDTETKKLIKTQASKITRLEWKVNKLQSEIMDNKDMVLKAYQLVRACKEAGEFHYCDDHGDD